MAKKAVAKPKMYINGVVNSDGEYFIRWDDEPFFNLSVCKEDAEMNDLLEGEDKAVIYELVPVCIGTSETKTTWRNLK